jgi:hypothetical protein
VTQDLISLARTIAFEVNSASKTINGGAKHCYLDYLGRKAWSARTVPAIKERLVEQGCF